MYNHLFKLGVLTSVFLMAGCASVSYQPQGIRGGYSEDKLDESSYRVTYYGNGDVSAEKAVDFALLRASVLLSKQQSQAVISQLSVDVNKVGIGSGLCSHKPTARLNVSSDLGNEPQEQVDCELLSFAAFIPVPDKSFVIDADTCIETIATKYKLTAEQLAES